MSLFSLNSTLCNDTELVGELKLCQIRLMNEQQFNWIILVPQRPDMTELHDLSAMDREQVCAEILAVSETMQTYTGADKMNIGALGNLVPQLHIHIISRFKDDPAWPLPVWGNYSAMPLSDSELAKKIAKLQQLFSDTSEAFVPC